MAIVTIKEVFDEQFADVKFDRKLCQRIIQYSNTFMTRNEDHSAFFGGVLLGVNPIRFLDKDRDEWYDDVLGVDEALLLSAFKKITSINHDFNVQGDLFNYTPVYVAYRLITSVGIPDKLSREAQIHAFMVLHYRFLTSLLIPRFKKYQANREVAQATYSMLSGRFDIRRYGSWRALLEARSKSIVDPNSKTYGEVMATFKPDPMVIRVVTDTQTRIRELVKLIYSVYAENAKRDVRSKSTSATGIGTDGEMILHDMKNGYRTYLRYIAQVVQNKNSFIKDELVEVVSAAVPTMPQKLFEQSLNYLSDHYGKPGHNYLETIVEEVMLYVFNYLQNNRQQLGNTQDLATLISKVRYLITAARTTDSSVLRMRSDAEKMVNKAVRSKNKAVISSVRTGVLLYIVLRAMTRQHYS